MRLHGRLPLLVFLIGCSETGLRTNTDPVGPVGPAIALSSDRLSFGEVPFGTTATLPLTVSSVGTAPLELFGFTLGTGTAFGLEGDPPLGPLEPGASLELTVRFTPTTLAEDDLLTVASDDPDLPEAPVLLDGGGVGAHLVWEPAEVVFAPLTVGCEAEGTATLRNVGVTKAELFGVLSTGTTLLVDPTAATSLPPGQGIPVRLRFVPDTASEQRAELIASSNALPPTTEASLSGTGTLPVWDTPAEADAGTAVLGCEATLEIPWTIDADCDRLVSVEVIGDSFALTTTDPVVAAPAAVQLTSLTVTPRGLGVDTGELVLTDVLSGEVARVPLLVSGTGELQEDRFEVWPRAQAPVYLSGINGLYEFYPDTELLVYLGPTPGAYYDIAIDAAGVLWGIASTGVLYRIDPVTLDQTRHDDIGFGNGLTILDDGTLLLANGTAIYDVDWDTGTTRQVAVLPAACSGDITEADDRMYATVGWVGGDQLAEVLPNGTSALIGPTGRTGLWGLAWYERQLLAFGSAGGAWELDPSTGAAVRSLVAPGAWYGAAHNPTWQQDLPWTFPLSEQPTGELQVEVDGAPRVDWVYDPVTNEVVFPDPQAFLGGERVVVGYSVTECPP